MESDIANIVDIISKEITKMRKLNVEPKWLIVDNATFAGIKQYIDLKLVQHSFNSDGNPRTKVMGLYVATVSDDIPTLEVR